jgi:hypothetical protein
MSPTPVPARITIDFRDAVLPSRAWILGIDESATRVELLAFEAPLVAPEAALPSRAPGNWIACTCPEFCELDHANE